MKRTKTPHVSVVIPVFNEIKRLRPGIAGAIVYLKKQPFQSEIVIVDDGSTDATVVSAQKILGDFPHQILVHDHNRGKGAALKTGVLAASGRYIIFSDVDFSTPIAQMHMFLKALEKHEVAIGVRRHPKSRVQVHQPKLREFLGHCFTKLTNLVATPGIYDVTCGFKGFQKQAGQTLFSKQLIDRWAFDAEILFLARKYRYRIAQIPVTWSNNPATKVHMWRDGIRTAYDLLKIRILDLLGKYDF